MLLPDGGMSLLAACSMDNRHLVLRVGLQNSAFLDGENCMHTCTFSPIITIVVVAAEMRPQPPVSSVLVLLATNAVS